MLVRYGTPTLDLLEAGVARPVHSTAVTLPTDLDVAVAAAPCAELAEPLSTQDEELTNLVPVAMRVVSTALLSGHSEAKPAVSESEPLPAVEWLPLQTP